jgi:hypothetical protein
MKRRNYFILENEKFLRYSVKCSRGKKCVGYKKNGRINWETRSNRPSETMPPVCFECKKEANNLY